MHTLFIRSQFFVTFKRFISITKRPNKWFYKILKKKQQLQVHSNKKPQNTTETITLSFTTKLKLPIFCAVKKKFAHFVYKSILTSIFWPFILHFFWVVSVLFPKNEISFFFFFFPLLGKTIIILKMKLKDEKEQNICNLF